MSKKIVPTMEYELGTGKLQLVIGKRLFGVFESHDDYGQPFTRTALADELGEILADAFNALPEAVRLAARAPIDSAT